MSGRVRFRRYRHADSVIYTVYVLWIIGYSQRAIARGLGMRPKQVAGIIHNSGIYRDRASMPDPVRAQHLADLQEIRFGDDGSSIDGGVLDRIPFRIRPLGGRQSKGPLSRKVRG